MTRHDPIVAAPSARDPVEELAEDFLERYRRGERPALTEFIDRAPEHADEIRDLFPALVLMEQAGPAAPAPPADAAPAAPLNRLGDYRIIREVGRGGMGIVYEADQEALDRHVALKVLPSPAAADSHCLLRFRREARSAARLHHTNIVPVFDIGERDGVHYYAMQFIQGQGLDEVIKELHELRPGRGHRAPAGPVSAVSYLAESLLTSNFQVGDAAQLRPALTASPSETGQGNASSVLTDHSDFSTKSDFHFYRSVARIGLQVADALAYAHGQRVLHRDIKPSNLLLDAHGTVWVTDFGLAKEAGDDLTRTGDIVGTLRYMAPERFSGISDARSDIYSLGLTLYELLTLRPAFPETDRLRLVQTITHREPDAPRQLDPHVPRDLETIVLKAITKESARRYTSAEYMREDLRRFLSDRPIQARRTTWVEQGWRWCRRNPLPASLAAGVSILSLALLIGLGIGNLLWQQRDLALAAQGRAETAQAEASELLTRAQNAEREVTIRSHLSKGVALRRSGQVGQRFECLAELVKALRLDPAPELREEIRDEAVAALVLADVELYREWEGYPEGTVLFANDASFLRYARSNKQGELTVCRLSEHGEEVIARLPAYGRVPHWGLWMSPEGRYLAFGHSKRQQGNGGSLRIWKLDGPTPTVHWDAPAETVVYSLAFHADGRRLAIGYVDLTISVHDLESTDPPQRLQLDRVPWRLAFHPRDGRLAVACGDAVRLLDTDTGQELPALRLPKIDTWQHGLAWHPDGRVLAATSADMKIHLWDTETATEIMSPLEGHTASGVYMTFNHAGDRLISNSWDGQTRLWDAGNGRLLLTMPGNYGEQFSGDDALIGLGRSGTKLRLWRLAGGRELRTIRRPGADRTETIFSPTLAADGRVLTAASNNGLGFFDLDSGRELEFARFQNNTLVYPRAFDQTRGLITGGNRATLLWPVRRDAARGDLLHIGPPRTLAVSVDVGADISSDGRIRAFPQSNQTLVLDRDRPGRRVELGPQHDVRFCAVSPDGKWVATCSWFSDGLSKSIRIWEAETGRQVRDLPVEGNSYAAFSPDGQWLATFTSGMGCRVWSVHNWQEVARFDRYSCWSPDGRLLAMTDGPGVIRLVKAEGWTEVFRFTGPEVRGFYAACMTRDGTRLIATVSDLSALYVWDLRLIRQQLKELGLDWDWPEFPPVMDADSTRSPLAIQVDPGILRPPVLEDDRDTVAAFTLLLALQPLNPEAYLTRGLAHGRLDENAKAVADYEMFLALTSRIDRRRSEVHLRRATNYFEYLKDDPKAMAALADAADAPLELIPWPYRCAFMCNELAWRSVKAPSGSGLPDAVLPLARKAVELEPYNFEYQNTLGVALYRAAEYDEASRCLKKNLEHSGQLAAYDLYVLAMSHQRLGQRAKARGYFDRANAAVEAATGLSPGHRQQLADFRAEAEEVLGISKPK